MEATGDLCPRPELCLVAKPSWVFNLLSRTLMAGTCSWHSILHTPSGETRYISSGYSYQYLHHILNASDVVCNYRDPNYTDLVRVVR
jgi:hypothetical protein